MDTAELTLREEILVEIIKQKIQCISLEQPFQNPYHAISDKIIAGIPKIGAAYHDVLYLRLRLTISNNLPGFA